MDGSHEILLQADHACQGQLIIEDMSTNEQSAYDYDLQLISSQPIPFNIEGFSGPSWTQTNMQLVLKEEPETQVYLSPTDQGELALAYSNSLLFDTVNETEPSLSLSLSPVTNSWEDGTVGVALYPDPYLQVIRTWREALTSDDPVDYIDSCVTFHVKELNLPIQYAFHDFNEDGINEMMVLFDSSIIEIYRLQDQELVPLFNDPTLAERSHLTLYSTNQIGVRQTSGAAYNYFTLYELNDNGSGVTAIGRMANEEGIITSEGAVVAVNLNNFENSQLLDLTDFAWKNVFADYDMTQTDPPSLSFDDFKGIYEHDLGTHLLTINIKDHAIQVVGDGAPTLGYAIEDTYILGDTLYSQAASSASRRQQNYSLMEREGKKVLVDPVGNQYVETTQSNAIQADYTENLASDEEFALMAFLEMTDSYCQDLALVGMKSITDNE